MLTRFCGKICCVLSALGVLSLVSSGVLAQTDSSIGFFPLHTGDLHQFHYHYSTACPGFPPHSSYHVERVLQDTLLPTGFLYKILKWGGSPTRYLRVDTSTANVYKYESSPFPHDVLMDSLRATEGSTFIRDSWYLTECTDVDTLTVLGVQTIVKRFRVYFIFGADYSLAYGFGRIQEIGYQEDPCYPLLDPLYLDLVFARIAGHEFGTFVSAQEQTDQLPKAVKLAQNYPNPCNPSTTITYQLPTQSPVTLKVFDLLGREVATLVNEIKPPGAYEATWNTSYVASGVYFYRLQAGDFVQTKKLVLMR